MLELVAGWFGSDFGLEFLAKLFSLSCVLRDGLFFIIYGLVLGRIAKVALIYVELVKSLRLLLYYFVVFSAGKAL